MTGLDSASMTSVIEILSSPRAVEPMADSVNGENTTPSLKRKASVDEVGASIQKAKKSTPDKRVKPTGKKPLVKLNGRKLIFNQQTALPAAAEQVSSRALAWSLFHTQRIQAAKASGDCEGKQWDVPDDFLDVVAYHGHEKRLQTVSLLAKRIAKDMSSVPGYEVSTKWLDGIIPSLFDQRDYGVSPHDISGSPKIPATLQLKVWELKDVSRWLCPPHYPANMAQALQERRQEREQARKEVLQAVEKMDDVEKLELLKGESESKESKPSSLPEANVEPLVQEEEPDTGAASALNKSLVDSERGRRESTVASTSSRRSASPGKKSKLTPEEQEARQRKRDERQAKAAQKAEEKALKDAEVARKEAAVAKQAQTMSMFFKPKTAAAAAPARPALPTVKPLSPSASPTPASPQPTVSDYRRTFRGITKKANVDWADMNIWRRDPRRRSSPEAESSKQAVMEQWKARDFLEDHLRLPHKVSRRRLPSGLKTAPLYGSIADAWTSYQEADDPRKLMGMIKSRRRFPWKTLAFDQQTRPPYCGTFTKKSAAVGPRTPFAQDPIFDYSYDSGDEWQEEEPGEDVDGPGEAMDVDDEDEDESEGEFDDWLDDAEDGADAPLAAEEDPLVQDTLKLPSVKQAREAPVKRVVKVTPFWRGPMWEKGFGEGNEGMEAFRLQLLNDTPSSLDPFSFSSSEAPQAFKASYTTISISMNLSVRCLTSATPTVPEPALDTESAIPTARADDPAKTALAPKGPKVAFPAALLAELYAAIEGSSDIRIDLVSKLRAQFDGRATKVATEMKLKDVAERQGKAKGSVWRVKDEAWLAAGLQVPAREAIVKEDGKVAKIEDRVQQPPHVLASRDILPKSSYQEPIEVD